MTNSIRFIIPSFILILMSIIEIEKKKSKNIVEFLNSINIKIILRLIKKV